MADKRCLVAYSFILPQKPDVPDSQSLLLYIMKKMETEKFQAFKRELSEDYPECLGSEPDELSVSDAAKKIVESFGEVGAWRITFHFLTNGKAIITCVFYGLKNTLFTVNIS